MASLISFVNILFWVLNVAIFLRVLFSWINPDPYNPLVAFIYQITEPIMQPLSRIIPPLGGLDITPFIAWLLLDIVRRVVLAILIRFV